MGILCLVISFTNKSTNSDIIFSYTAKLTSRNEEGDVLLSNYNAGDVVYIFYRNPHIQNVANIQEAAVVNSPDNPNELALFLYETYYPLSTEMAIYANEAEAEHAYRQYFH
ncbi:hypothetical protein PB01_06170 [Psychrobacillus glaciei]|uniref:Transcriptional regulator n=1 Tax=Psychrobacillus glaciei TaxID=2283160 RepID=A0A5J6SKH3_9BACI|nr:hypothetical protein PB01_06170 [Psychrobacillus glaciei]